MSSSLTLLDLGRDVAYPAGLRAMEDAARDVDDAPRLLFLEHAPVLTVTRSHGRAHLLVDDDTLRARGIALHEASRGGDITFHGPGQLVGYPVIRLARANGSVDLVGYVRALEGALVAACRALGATTAHTEPGLTGVWVGAPGSTAEKLVSIGVGVSPRGVTRHGFALNVDIALRDYLACAVPCGLADRAMTTLRAHLGDATPDLVTVKRTVALAVAEALGFVDVTLDSRRPVTSTAQPPVSPFPIDGALHG